MQIGVLALQGDYPRHLQALSKLGISSIQVREPNQLKSCSGLILPGGESSTQIKLMHPVNMMPAIEQFHADGGAIFGTCAGLILLASKITPSQPSLGLLDLHVMRNAYGHQIHSTHAKATWQADSMGADPLTLTLIRAPKITTLTQPVQVLACLGEQPVLVQQNRILGATFHPELSSQHIIYQHFIALCQNTVK